MAALVTLAVFIASLALWVRHLLRRPRPELSFLMNPGSGHRYQPHSFNARGARHDN